MKATRPLALAGTHTIRRQFGDRALVDSYYPVQRYLSSAPDRRRSVALSVAGPKWVPVDIGK
jgi:hypothetical protein